MLDTGGPATVRPFSFARRADSRSAGAVKPFWRRFLLLLLLLVTAFAAWAWLRPYSWQGDGGSHLKIEGAQLRRDHRNYWLDLYLQQSGGEAFDPAKPIELITANGKRHTAADITLESIDQKTTTGVILKFWLEPADLTGPIQLKVNGGELVVKSNARTPELVDAERRALRTSSW